MLISVQCVTWGLTVKVPVVELRNIGAARDRCKAALICSTVFVTSLPKVRFPKRSSTWFEYEDSSTGWKDNLFHPYPRFGNQGLELRVWAVACSETWKRVMAWCWPTCSSWNQTSSYRAQPDEIQYCAIYILAPVPLTDIETSEQCRKINFRKLILADELRKATAEDTRLGLAIRWARLWEANVPCNDKCSNAYLQIANKNTEAWCEKAPEYSNVMFRVLILFTGKLDVDTFCKTSKTT